MKGNSESLRLLLTILLCFGLLMGYGQYAEYKKKQFYEEHPEALKPLKQEESLSEIKSEKSNADVATPASKSIPQTTIVSSKDISQKEDLYTLESTNLKVTFSTKGGVVTSNQLIGYHQTHDFSLNGLTGYETGSLVFSNDVRNGNTPLYYKMTHKDDKSIVFETTFSTPNGANLNVIKVYTMDAHGINMSVDVKNIGSLTYGDSMYVINGSTDGLPKDHPKNAFDITTLSYTQGDENEDILSAGFGSMFGEKKDYERIEATTSWIALKSRFYFQAINPKGQSYPSVFWTPIDTTGYKNYVGAYEIKGLLSGATSRHYDFTYEFLPQSRSLFNSLYNDEKKDYYLVHQQFSFMKIISDVLYFCIEWIYDLTKDYGVTIILVTIFIKLLFYPLTQKSYRSMQKMQKISPKVQELRKKYAGNPTRMNTEMMALYKKEDVNMMAGCLPMLLPIPIFIALYMLFRNMFELEGVNFLWIKDLSSPDAIFSFDSNIPLVGKSIQLLPFLLVITQVIQNKFTTYSNAGVDNETVRMQMMMMKYMMPAMFFIISWTLPSALTLYWLIQNIFTIGQTFYVRKGLEKEKS